MATGNMEDISSSSGISNRLKFPVAQRLGPDSEMMNELPGKQCH